MQRQRQQPIAPPTAAQYVHGQVSSTESAHQAAEDYKYGRIAELSITSESEIEHSSLDFSVIDGSSGNSEDGSLLDGSSGIQSESDGSAMVRTKQTERKKVE